MKVGLYDKVLLKSGETAYIVEIHKQDVDYEADIDRREGYSETVPISHQDIDSVLHKAVGVTF